MKLSVIITSFNTKQLLQECLEPIFTNGFPKDEYEVIVIDNASADDSTEMIKKNFPQVKLIRNKKNLGFTQANNQGIKVSRGEYILLLNSDTEVKTDALTQLTQFMDSHPQTGIASAQLLNPDGSIQQSGGYLPRLSNLMAWMWLIDDLPWVKPWFWAYHLTSKNFYHHTRPIGWVQGAAMVIRRQTLNQIGDLDEKIFMYGEDIDLCWRAKNKSWQIWHIAEAKVIHKKFQSSAGSSEKAILGEYQNLKYLFTKHKPAWELPILKLVLKSGALLRMLLFGTILPDKDRYAIYTQAFKLAGQ